MEQNKNLWKIWSQTSMNLRSRNQREIEKRIDNRRIKLLSQRNRQPNCSENPTNFASISTRLNQRSNLLQICKTKTLSLHTQSHSSNKNWRLYHWAISFKSKPLIFRTELINTRKSMNLTLQSGGSSGRDGIRGRRRRNLFHFNVLSHCCVDRSSG